MVRRHFIRGLASILLLLSVLSCNTKSTGSCYTLQLPMDFQDKLVDSIDIIKLDSSVPLSRINSVKLINDSFYVLARNGLFKYNKNGDFISQISRKGRAEQEWLIISAFYYSEKFNDLCIIDDFSSKILHFTLEGEFLYSEPVKFGRNYYVEDAEEVSGGILLSCSIYTDNGVVFAYLPYNSDVDIVEVKEIPFRSENVIEPTGLRMMSCTRDSARCILPFDNNIYRFSEGAFSAITSVPAKYPLPGKKFFKKYIHSYDSSEILMQCIRQGLFYGYSGIYETSDWMLLSSHDISCTIIEKSTNNCYVFERNELIEQIGFPIANVYSAIGHTLVSVFDESQIRMILDNESIDNALRKKIENALGNDEENSSASVIVLYELTGD